MIQYWDIITNSINKWSWGASNFCGHAYRLQTCACVFWKNMLDWVTLSMQFWRSSRIFHLSKKQKNAKQFCSCQKIVMCLCKVRWKPFTAYATYVDNKNFTIYFSYFRKICLLFINLIWWRGQNKTNDSIFV